MTVERLAVTVLLCAGFNAISVGARESGRPLAVAVPLTGKAVAVTSGKAATAEDDPADPAEMTGPAGELETLPPLDEDLPPLDLSAEENGASDSAAEDGDAARASGEQASVIEPVVLGLEGAPPRPSYFVHAEILGLPNGDGFIAASLCTRQTFTKSGCRTERVVARPGQVSVTFSNVAPGSYAVQVHHDQNGNGKMDFSFFGLPKEPYGFSRDAKPMLAPPKFESASFNVVDGDVSLVINLQNT